MVEPKNCLLTGLPLIEKIHFETQLGTETYLYLIEVNNARIPVSLCTILYDELMWSEDVISKYVNENRIFLIGELAKDDFKSLKGKVFHSLCNINDKPNHFQIRDFIEKIISKGGYSKKRKEKYNNFLRFLHQSQQ
jgi:hypothetical protein